MRLSDFPLEVFPDTFHDTILEIAAASHLPVPQVAVCVMVATGIMCRAGVTAREPDRSDGVRPNLNLLAAGHPGAGKGQADNHIHAPIVEASKRFQAQWHRKVSDALREQYILEIQLADLKKNKANRDEEAYAKTFHETRERLDLIASVLKTTGPCMTLTEATEPAHTEQLAINQSYWKLLKHPSPELGGCLAVVSKDGSKALSWLTPIRLPGGDYTSQSGTALSSWCGESVISKRVGRAATVVEEAITSFLVAVTPSTFKKFLNNPGLRADGLASRFLFVMHEGWQRKERRKLPCAVTLAEYKQKMLALFERFGLAGRRTEVKVTQKASDRFDAFRCTVIDHACTMWLDVRELTVRWPEMALKMALILHLMEHGADAPKHEIDEKRADDGCRLMRYYANTLVALLEEERAEKRTAMQKRIAELLADRGDKGMKIGEGWRRGIGKSATESKELFMKEAAAERVKIVYSWRGGRETATAFLPTEKAGIAAAEAQREQAIVERTAAELSAKHSLDPAQSSLQAAVVGDGGEVPNWKPKLIRKPLQQSELPL